ncbi:hypothetical protein HPB51_011997 [Rhipicephalus microplus]|uniref:Uncharacterized protein n=1 Tax=Rhipicephalus microplus TaxID=6941 RepID=A0A9J6F1Q0_RHIMP|nr:hypothetical protein HPB51_011997 [Rhipicephalus microplus]
MLPTDAGEAVGQTLLLRKFFASTASGLARRDTFAKIQYTTPPYFVKVRERSLGQNSGHGRSVIRGVVAATIYKADLAAACEDQFVQATASASGSLLRHSWRAYRHRSKRRQDFSKEVRKYEKRPKGRVPGVQTGENVERTGAERCVEMKESVRQSALVRQDELLRVDRGHDFRAAAAVRRLATNVDRALRETYSRGVVAARPDQSALFADNVTDDDAREMKGVMSA